MGEPEKMEITPLPAAPTISISIVSHLQWGLVEHLLADLENCCGTCSVEVLITLNKPEKVSLDPGHYSFAVSIFSNSSSRGFAENHNQAFLRSRGDYFCVMNPDIRLDVNPFASLLGGLADVAAGVAAPRVIGRHGQLEDSFRRYPTPLRIFRKALGKRKGSDYAVEEKPIFPDWVGGMFMLFPREVFRKVGGFDERYFLYYEDVDICARLRLAGYRAVLCPEVSVIHDARRTSHRNLRYMRWHLASMARFFFSNAYRELGRKGLL
jgi:GT2 family glycosyltransferase